jgi:hypothetical protein
MGKAIMKRWVTAVSLLAASVGAAACPLCAQSQGYSSAEELAFRHRADTTRSASVPPDVVDVVRDEAPTAIASVRLDREAAASAVLALAEQGESRLKVVEVIRGEMPVGGTIERSWVIGLDRGAAPDAKPVLLIRARKWQSWANVGSIGVERASWLRQLSSTRPTSLLTDAEWRAQAEFVLPYLEDAEPLVAEIAYGELARAPYSTLRALKGRLDTRDLRQWTADPQLAKRQSLYTLLLGIGGDATDEARIEQRLDAAWKAKDATNLGPMLAASLELQGPSRMAWIDAKYMRDIDRTKPELDAVLLALSVQGGANAAIPRERVIQSYRTFIDVHKDLAGFVAQDLAGWSYWDAAPVYIALLRSDVVRNAASRYAMVNYLRHSPRIGDRAAIDTSTSAGQ